jgi:hypothetical protein
MLIGLLSHEFKSSQFEGSGGYDGFQLSDQGASGSSYQGEVRDGLNGLERLQSHKHSYNGVSCEI